MQSKGTFSATDRAAVVTHIRALESGNDLLRALLEPDVPASEWPTPDEWARFRLDMRAHELHALEVLT